MRSALAFTHATRFAYVCARVVRDSMPSSRARARPVGRGWVGGWVRGAAAMGSKEAGAGDAWIVKRAQSREGARDSGADSRGDAVAPASQERQKRTQTASGSRGRRALTPAPRLPATHAAAATAQAGAQNKEDAVWVASKGGCWAG